MNDLSKEKTMTIKEIAEYLNLSERTVQRRAKKCGIILKQGESKQWSKEDVTAILNVNTTVGMSEYVTKNELKEILNQQNIFLQSLLDRQNDFNQKLLQMNNNKQDIKMIGNKHNKVTIKEYIDKNNIISYNKQALLIQAGRQATRLSKELHRDISFKREGDYDVNMYDEDLLDTAVIVAKKIIEKNNVLF